MFSSVFKNLQIFFIVNALNNKVSEKYLVFWQLRRKKIPNNFLTILYKFSNIELKYEAVAVFVFFF